VANQALDQQILNMENQEKFHSIPHSFLIRVIETLQIGLENTEEVFVINGSRDTRTQRENAKRLEAEMSYIGNVITELKTFL
jgi:hypothetical protein